MGLSKALLFKFDETDKKVTLVGKSWVYCILVLRENSIPAESTSKVAVNATK